MLDVLIYSEHSSNRFKYVLNWIFKGVSSFQITHDVDLAIKYNGPIIFYSNKPIRQDALRIPDSGYLWRRKSEPLLPDLALVTFPLNNLDVDIFSFIYYSLARCEEYNKNDLDVWGRFKAENSIAFKNNYLQIPYVDLVKVRFFDFLKEKWPSFLAPLSMYKRQISYDIDVAWAYLYRSLPRHFYGVCRDVLRRDFSSIYHRWQVLSSNEVDPYFTFSRLLTTHAALGDQPIFFWLMGNKSKIDRAVGLKSKAFKQLIHDVSSKSELLPEAYPTLDELAQTMLENPNIRILLEGHTSNEGVENDYSMGYASQCGFRAGTCFPFLWFDEDRDICTNLMIHPFQAMDVTFWVYGENTSKDILATLENIENQCKSVGGTFTFIAHNSSFSGPGTWKAWEEIYFTFLKNTKI
ncbi:MAG: hypothetical protein RJA90_928 [Bacteroidota bacterium]